MIWQLLDIFVGVGGDGDFYSHEYTFKQTSDAFLWASLAYIV